MDHHSGPVFASVFGRRKDAISLHRKALLESFGFTRLLTDEGMPPCGMETLRSLSLGRNIRRIGKAPDADHAVGASHVLFFHTERLPALVSGLCLNRYACGMSIACRIHSAPSPATCHQKHARRSPPMFQPPADLSLWEESSCSRPFFTAYRCRLSTWPSRTSSRQPPQLPACGNVPSTRS